MEIKSKNKGFTLIELLIYTTVFAMAAGLLTIILITITRVQNVETVNNQIGQELNLVLKTVQRLVGDASLIECVGDATNVTDQSNCGLSTIPGSFLRLRFQDIAKDPTCIYLDTSTNVIKLAGPDATNKYCDTTTATNLTTSQVKVVNPTDLKFTKFDVPGGHATVQIEATLAYNSTNPDLQISRTLRSAIGRVSAATFDSDLLPNVDFVPPTTGHSIGQSSPSRRWKDVFIGNLLNLGKLTDAQEPLATAATTGAIYFNTSGNNIKVSNGTSWQYIGSQTPWTQNVNAASYTLFGNSTASGNLTLDSTSDVTKGNIILNPTGGNVGIGTTNPQRKFHIEQNSAGTPTTIAINNVDTTDGNGATLLSLRSTSTGAGATTFKEAAAIVGNVNVHDDATYTSSLDFWTRVSGTLAERMRIHTNGNVGIGTTAPAAKLSIGADGAIATTEKTVTTAAVMTVNWLDGNQQRIILNQAGHTINFSNYASGQLLRLVLCQDATGSRTVTVWDGSILWSGGTAPTLTATANKCDLLTFLATNATGPLKVFGGSVLNF